MRRRRKKREKTKMTCPSKDEAIISLSKDQPIADWNRNGWEELNDVSDALGVRGQTLIRWSNRDPDWPCGPIMRSVSKFDDTREHQYSGYYLPPGSLDALSTVYSAEEMPRRSPSERRDAIAEEKSALKNKLQSKLDFDSSKEGVREELQALQNKMDIITDALKSLGA